MEYSHGKIIDGSYQEVCVDISRLPKMQFRQLIVELGNYLIAYSHKSSYGNKSISSSSKILVNDEYSVDRVKEILIAGGEKPFSTKGLKLDEKTQTFFGELIAIEDGKIIANAFENKVGSYIQKSRSCNPNDDVRFVLRKEGSIVQKIVDSIAAEKPHTKSK